MIADGDSFWLDKGCCLSSSFMGDPARPGPQFLAGSTGEGEGGRFSAPQPLLVGLGAPTRGDAVFCIKGIRTKGCRTFVKGRVRAPARRWLATLVSPP